MLIMIWLLIGGAKKAILMVNIKIKTTTIKDLLFFIIVSHLIQGLNWGLSDKIKNYAVEPWSSSFEISL
jgi:hypothetical protein